MNTEPRPVKSGPWAFLPDSIYYGVLGLQNRLWYVPKTFRDGYEYRFMADMALPLALMATTIPAGLAILAAAVLQRLGIHLPPVAVPDAAGLLVPLLPLLAYLGILAYGLRTGRLFYRIEYSWGDEHHETVAWRRTNPRGDTVAAGRSVAGACGFRHPEELVSHSFGG